METRPLLVTCVVSLSLSLFGCDESSTTTEGSATTGTSSGSGPTSGTTDPTTATTTTTTLTGEASSTTTSDGTTDASTSTTAGSTGETTTGTGSSSGSSSSSGAGSECGMDAACVAPAPDGWDGPGLMLGEGKKSNDLPSCEDMQYSTEEASGWASVDPGTASCECGCEPEEDLTCSLLVSFWINQPCTGFAANDPMPTDECYLTIFGHESNFESIRVNAFSNSPDCTPTESFELPGVTTNDGRVVCAPSESGAACGVEGTCEPTSLSSQTYCIFQDGDQECPAGSDYTERTVISSGITDDRSCSSCECGAFEGTCNTTVSHYESDDCTGEPLVVDGPSIGAPECYSYPTTYRSAIGTVDELSGECPASGGELSGTVTIEQTTTLCCAEFLAG